MLPPHVILTPRRIVRAAALLAVVASLAPVMVDAQQRDSARVGAAPPAADTARRRVPPPDTVPPPPISPKRAFFSSVLVPGLGQAALDRPIAGSLFVALETISLVMIQKSIKELSFAKRNAGYVVTEYERECVPTQIPRGDEIIDTTLCYPVVDAEGNPVVVEGANRYAGGRLTARRQHVEDWIALLLANHLLAGADAYVAAHLWDLPARISIRPTDRGDVAVAASIAW